MLNPILRKDIKIYLRRSKFIISMVIYLIITLLILTFNINSIYSISGVNMEYIDIKFIGLVCLQIAIAVFIIPSISVSIMSSEREKQTLDILLTTKMTPFSIICGKFMSVISIFLLYVFVTLPIFSVISFFGGISLINFLILEIFVIIFSIFLSSMSIFFSIMIKRTSLSIVLSYLFVICMISMPIIISDVISRMFDVDYYDIFGIINILNPFFGFLVLISKTIGSLYLTINVISYINLIETDNIISFFINYSWIVSGVVSLLLSFVFIYISSKKLDKIG